MIDGTRALPVRSHAGGRWKLLITIREFEKDDLPAVLTIQRKCPLAAQWIASDYLQLASEPDGLLLVAELGSAPCFPARCTLPGSREPTGFCVVRRLEDEAELGNLAVDPECQRQGIGRALLADAHRRLGRAGVRRVYLEARRSNVAACELYARLGYTRVLVRTGYYNQPAEDAVVWLLKLDR